MKNYNEYINEEKTHKEKKDELNKYKIGNIVVFKSSFRKGEVGEYELISELRIGKIIEYDYSERIYRYVISDLFDNGQWLVTKSNVKRLASNKDIENYETKLDATKYNL